ncbi:MAG: insulinase family protein [Sulfurovum sp.]|nr:insulinase family protein [Sulfurovum sp.]
MAETVQKITYKDTKIPIVFETGNFVPIISMQLVFTNAGHLSNEKDGQADMSARILNEGTKKEGAVGFAKKLDAHAIELSAHVGRESFVIELSALKGEFKYGVDRLKELLENPNFTQEALAQVKQQKVGQLTQKKSDFDYIASTGLRQELFKGTPLARSYNGTMDSIKAMKIVDIEHFLKTRLGYNNLVVVAGGDIDFDKIQHYLLQVLPLLHKSKTKPTKFVRASDNNRTRLIKKDTQQAYIYFGAPFDYSYKEKDQYKAKITEYLLGGAGFGSRLMEELRVKRGLTYGAYCVLRRTKYSSYLSGYLQTKLSTQDEAVKLVQKVIKDFVAKGISAEELKAAKEFLVGSEPLRTETLSQRLNRAYSEYYYGRPLGFSQEQLKKIEKVTLKKINSFIKVHSELTDLSFVVVTKK